MPEVMGSGMQQQQQASIPSLQQEQWFPWQQQPQQLRASQHVQPQHQAQPQQQQWQVEVVLAGHDADIAHVKSAVQRLEEDSHATAAMTDGVAAQLHGLSHRVSALEQNAAAPAAVGVASSAQATSAVMSEPGSPATSSDSMATASQAAATAGAAVASAIGMLDQADVVSAIEGLAADVVQGAARLEALEDSARHHGAGLQDVKGATEHLPANLQQVGAWCAVAFSSTCAVNAVNEFSLT
jgi:hypothetical protein